MKNVENIYMNTRMKYMNSAENMHNNIGMNSIKKEKYTQEYMDEIIQSITCLHKNIKMK